MPNMPTPSPADQRIIDDVLALFLPLTKIPRPSGHEQAISDFLMAWAAGHGWAAQLDAQQNVIINIPATLGHESVPTIIFQAHTDMVCVADPSAKRPNGTAYSPEHDPIITHNDGTFLSAKGTSLGADDGIGVAIIQHIVAKADLAHGPLRICFTADEETGMSGASKIDPAHLEGTYLINVDGEEADTICTSSADCTLYSVQCPLSWGKAVGDAAVTIHIDGLRGGHSGINIHEGRGNALRLMGFAMAELMQHNIPFELAALSGGLAQNAIPPRATATVVLPAAHVPQAQSVLKNYADTMHGALQYTDAECTCTCTPASMPAKVTNAAQTAQIVHVLCLAHNGVYTMSPLVHGLVESSANLGVAAMDEQGFEARIFARSSSLEYSKQLDTLYKTLAHSTGCSCTMLHHSPGWPVDPTSRLVPWAQEIFAQKTGRALHVRPIHAGLECGYFLEKNPHLDIVVLGPQLDSPHSPAEKLHLHTIPAVVHIIEGLLQRIITDPAARSAVSA